MYLLLKDHTSLYSLYILYDGLYYNIKKYVNDSFLSLPIISTLYSNTFICTINTPLSPLTYIILPQHRYEHPATTRHYNPNKNNSS